MPTADLEGQVAAQALQDALRNVDGFLFSFDERTVLLTHREGCDRKAPMDLMLLCRALAGAPDLAPILAQADTAAQAVAEQDRLRSVLDFEKRARRVQKERADRLSAEVEARDKALTLLLSFADFAAGEGLMLEPDPDDAATRMDAADLCSAAAKALSIEIDGPEYAELVAAGCEAIQALAAGQDKEGGKP